MDVGGREGEEGGGTVPVNQVPFQKNITINPRKVSTIAIASRQKKNQIVAY